jgi:hypothetical protein
MKIIFSNRKKEGEMKETKFFLANRLTRILSISLLSFFFLSFPCIYAVDDYKIKLKSRQFSPFPEKDSLFETMELLKVEKRHVLIQFYSIPTAETKAMLEASGIKLFGYIPEKGFLASLEIKAKGQKAILEHVRWIGEFQPEDKINPRIQKGRFGGWARNEDGTVNILISLFPDEPQEKMKKLLSDYGSILYGPMVSENSISWSLKTPEDYIFRLANEDAVIWIEEIPPPAHGTNNESRRAIFVERLHGPAYNLHGAGETGAIMDAGFVHINHPDLAVRSVLGPFDQAGPPCKAQNDHHATHVAGTFVGDGTNSSSVFTGMADQANLRSYLWYPRLKSTGPCNLLDKVPEGPDTGTKFCDAVQQGSHVSNNSWGFIVKCDGFFPCQWEGGNCDLYGDYHSLSSLYDDLVRGVNTECSQQIPITIVFSAGNEQNDLDCKPDDECATGEKITPCDIDVVRGLHFPFYTLLPPGGTAKNTIVVGATYSDNEITTCFSSFGPTDDGRVKPDVVAPGDQNENNTCAQGLEIKSTWWPGLKYGDLAGTSMAAPAASGSALILYEQYGITNPGLTPLPSTIKALLINTAEDLGNKGPDYKYGYGLINVRKAVDTITNGDLLEGTINVQGQTNNHIINIPAANTKYLKVTLAWDDPPPAAPGAKDLVNDLDLCLIPPGGGGCSDFPFILDPNNPGLAATTGVDNTNNVEQVFVAPTPAMGNWTAQVTGTTVPNAPQNYSLVWIIVYGPDKDGDGDPGSSDCDDDDPETYTGAPELCDGIDNDCDGSLPANEADNDGDGVMVCENDCNDNDASIYPGAVDGAYPGILNCDGKDNDCDGPTDEGEDHDGDGTGDEICNDGVDNDCDGMLDGLDNPDCLTSAQQGESHGFTFHLNKIDFDWTPDPAYMVFNVYKGDLLTLKDNNLDGLPDNGYGTCFIDGTPVPQGSDSSTPSYPGGFMYIVTGEHTSGEGTMGFTTAGVERQNSAQCPTPPP